MVENGVFQRAVKEDGVLEKVLWNVYLDHIKVDVDDSVNRAAYTIFPQSGDKCARCYQKMEKTQTPNYIFMTGNGKYVRIFTEYEFCRKCETLLFLDMTVRFTSL